MATGEKKTSDHIKGFKNEIDSVTKDSAASFFNWFDESGGDVEETFLKGQREFLVHIMLPLHKRIGAPKKQVALEIGCGGGRLLAAATNVFGKVIGIDIHNSLPVVASELHTRGISNFELLQSDGKTIPLGNEKVDVVYSFIVLQHVEKIDVFNSYIAETHRVLRTGGYAILYYARFPRFSVNRSYKILYFIDRLIGFFFGNRYFEKMERVNVVNLLVGDRYASRRAKLAGFKIIGKGVSRKMDNPKKYGGQHYLLLQK